MNPDKRPSGRSERGIFVDPNPLFFRNSTVAVRFPDRRTVKKSGLILSKVLAYSVLCLFHLVLHGSRTRPRHLQRQKCKFSLIFSIFSRSEFHSPGACAVALAGSPAAGVQLRRRFPATRLVRRAAVNPLNCSVVV